MGEVSHTCNKYSVSRFKINIAYTSELYTLEVAEIHISEAGNPTISRSRTRPRLAARPGPSDSG